MPLHKCTTKGTPCYQWGDHGHKYPYKPGNAASERSARSKALKQGRAIEYFKRHPRS